MAILTKDSTIGVYVHVPYCISKCPYCDFNSVAVSRDGLASEALKRYAGCVLKELDAVAGSRGLSGRSCESVYFGGGTPTLLKPSLIKAIMEAILERFPGCEAPEITIEANPDTVTSESLEGYLGAGVNRISIGLQSLDDKHLSTLGRTHSAARALDAFTMARDAGFPNIGVDLIFALPGQTEAGWKAALEQAAALGAEHVSLYGLTLEEGTPFERSYAAAEGAALLPAEEAQARMYELAVKTLAGAGYNHYEISNFALPGHESVHNRRYWSGGDYVGLGAGAHSFYATPPWGMRSSNAKAPEEYMALVEDTGTAGVTCEELTETEARAEAVMLGLRMLDKGLDTALYRARFGPDAYTSLMARAERFTSAGLVDSTGSRLVLTEAGALVSDGIMLEMLG